MIHADFVPLDSAKRDIQPIVATRCDSKGKTTLEAVVQAGDLAAATGLVRSGVDVDCFTPEGFTPLMIASGLGYSQVVGLLLTAGAQVLAVEPRAGAMAHSFGLPSSRRVYRSALRPETSEVKP